MDNHRQFLWSENYVDSLQKFVLSLVDFYVSQLQNGWSNLIRGDQVKASAGFYFVEENKLKGILGYMGRPLDLTSQQSFYNQVMSFLLQSAWNYFVFHLARHLGVFWLFPGVEKELNCLEIDGMPVQLCIGIRFGTVKFKIEYDIVEMACFPTKQCGNWIVIRYHSDTQIFRAYVGIRMLKKLNAKEQFL